MGALEDTAKTVAVSLCGVLRLFSSSQLHVHEPTPITLATRQSPGASARQSVHSNAVATIGYRRPLRALEIEFVNGRSIVPGGSAQIYRQ